MQVDGAIGEGGGQVLRTSLSLAALLGEPLHVVNIRAGRKKPGLQPQHLTCVNAIARITRARVQGNHIGSTELILEPQELEGGTHEFDIGTAGATGLLLQCLLPPLLFASKPSTLALRGGTDVPFSPPSFFVEEVFVKALNEMGADVHVRFPKHGFYPTGGGLAYAKIEPVDAFRPLSLENRGKMRELNAVALSANLPDHVSSRQKNVLAKKRPEAQIEVQNVTAQSPGNLVFLKAEYEEVTNGFSSLGEVGKPAETVAQEALNTFDAFDQSRACVEEHLADQLLIYAALAEGETRLRVERLSAHAVTNLEVLRQRLNVRANTRDNTIHIYGKALRPR